MGLDEKDWIALEKYFDEIIKQLEYINTNLRKYEMKIKKLKKNYTEEDLYIKINDIIEHLNKLN